MKRKLLFIFFNVVLFSCTAQKTDYYSHNSNEILVSSFEKVQTEVTFVEKEESASSGVVTFLISSAVTIIFKNLSKVFYNPKKYMKEYSGEYNFLTNGYDIEEGFPKNKDLLVRTSGMLGDKNTTISEYRFTIRLLDSISQYHSINLKNMSINYTPVKLKHKLKGNGVNSAINLKFTFFNEFNERIDYSLKPITIKNVIPQENMAHKIAPNFQIVPSFKYIERINISVSEVNSRKKHWDRWLKLYQDNQGKVSEFIIGEIKK